MIHLLLSVKCCHEVTNTYITPSVRLAGFFLDAQLMAFVADAVQCRIYIRYTRSTNATMTLATSNVCGTGRAYTHCSTPVCAAPATIKLSHYDIIPDARCRGLVVVSLK